MKRTFIAALLLVAFACDPPSPPEPEKVAAPPPTPAVDKPAPEPEVSAISLPGTPHDEEFAQISIVWAGAAGELELAAKPGGIAEEKLEVTDGQNLEFDESVVLIAKPTYVEARPGAKLFGTTPIGHDEAEPKDIDLPAGATVGILKYAGEGTCVVKHEAAMYYAGCPAAEMFDGDVNARPAADWWIKPTGAGGWLLVDKRFKVDVTQSEGE